MRSKITGTCFFMKKKPPVGQNRDNENWRTEFVFNRIQISRYPDIQMSRYTDVQMSRYPDIQMSTSQVSDTRYQVSKLAFLSLSSHDDLVCTWSPIKASCSFDLLFLVHSNFRLLNFKLQDLWYSALFFK